MLLKVQKDTDKMAKLASFRRIIKTDYAEEYQALVEQLATSINNGFDTVFNALNGKLNFSDNIAATITEFKVAVNADGRPLQKTQFKLNDNQTTVTGLLVLNTQGATDPSLYATSGLSISYTISGGNVIINNIKGLETDKSYLIRVLALS